MCWAAAIPMLTGAAMTAGSMYMNAQSEKKAYNQRDDVLQSMFARQNETQGNINSEFTQSLEPYRPGAQEFAINQEQQAIEGRMGEQYQAAQASAPQHTDYGVVTPGYTRQKAEFETQRAQDAVDRAHSYAAVAAPEHVRQAQAIDQQRLGEGWNQQIMGDSALNQLDQMQYGGISPQYSPWAGVMSSVGGGLMTQGLGTAFAGGMNPSGPNGWGAVNDVNQFMPADIAQRGGSTPYAWGRSAPGANWR